MQKPGLFGMNGFMVFLLTCFSVVASAQQTGYLILIDAENKQPFTVRIGDQLFVSSGHGHLLLSRLIDSTYKLNLAFPKKNINDQVFTVAIRRRDLGFLLKGGDDAVLLYNWQSREILKPDFEKDSSRTLEKGIKREDGFSKLMAAVVNDTAVMYNISTPYVGSTTPNSSISVVSTVVPNVDVPSSQLLSETPVATHRQPINLNKDSLLEAKRQEVHMRDSLNLARKTSSRDSLTAARKQMAFVKDSMNTARKVALKDSLTTIKKQQIALKDSLIAARKARKDSLAAAKKGGVIRDSSMIAENLRQSNDSLTETKRMNSVNDSLLAANNAKARDSQRRVVESRSLASGKRPTKMPSGIKKLREVSLKISRKMVFLDIGQDGKVDTVILFVYFETNADNLSKSQPPRSALVKQKPKLPDTLTQKNAQLKIKNSDTTGNSRLLLGNKVTDTTGFAKALQKKTVLKGGDAACAQVATEEDTQFLRSAILKANSEQEKIAVASDAFAMKCFSVSQVRFLAGLLVSDKAKYSLMYAAHLHVADKEHFRELVDMLSDKNFQRKFLAMAEKRS